MRPQEGDMLPTLYGFVKMIDNPAMTLLNTA